MRGLRTTLLAVLTTTIATGSGAQPLWNEDQEILAGGVYARTYGARLVVLQPDVPYSFLYSYTFDGARFLADGSGGAFLGTSCDWDAVDVAAIADGVIIASSGETSASEPTVVELVPWSLASGSTFFGGVTGCANAIDAAKDIFVVGQVDNELVFVAENLPDLGGWVATLYLDRSGDQLFGRDVSLDGDTLAIGVPDPDSYGTVEVYRRPAPGSWVLDKVIEPSRLEIGGQFGYSVAVSGDWLLVGAPTSDVPNFATDSGAITFFRRDGGNWNEVRTLRSIFSGDNLGWSVAMRGDRAIAGAPGTRRSDFVPASGAAYLYRLVAGDWIGEWTLGPAAFGSFDYFGTDVDLAPGGAVVGSRYSGIYYFSPPIFSDGFETGDTSRWSATLD